VADSHEAIADVVTTLLSNAPLRQQIGQAGQCYVKTHHDWNAAAERLETIYREVIAERAALMQL